MVIIVIVIIGPPRHPLYPTSVFSYRIHSFVFVVILYAQCMHQNFSVEMAIKIHTTKSILIIFILII